MVRDRKCRKEYWYRQIVFLQGQAAEEALQILDEHGELAAINHLAELEGDEGEMRYRSSAGNVDHVRCTKDGFILSYNLRIGYIGLQRKELQN